RTASRGGGGRCEAAPAPRRRRTVVTVWAMTVEHSGRVDERVQAHVERRWDEIVPVLHDYIAIPNVSAAFDPEWRVNGHMQAAVDLVRDWCASRSIAGLAVEVHELPGRSPVVVVDVPAFGA